MRLIIRLFGRVFGVNRCRTDNILKRGSRFGGLVSRSAVGLGAVAAGGFWSK